MSETVTAERSAEIAPSSSAAAFDVLYRLTDRLYRAPAIEAALDAALDAIAEGLHCDRCSILLFDDDDVMRFVAWRGLSEGYRTALEGHSPWTREDIDPPAIYVSDIAETSEPQWVKTRILEEDIRCLAFIPLTAQGRVIGKFMSYDRTRRDFSPDERALSLTIARQLGFYLERARSELSRQDTLRELKESEERFRLMSEHAPVMIWMSTAKGSCLHLNRMLREFWSVREEDIPTFDWRTTMHPDDMAHIMETMIGALQAQKPVSVSGRYRNQLGEYRVLQTVAQPRFGTGGAFMGMTGVNIDITDRERAEKALRESEERFRLVVEASPCGMIMTDGDGTILMINAKAEKLFGYEPGELIGQAVEILVPVAHRAEHPRLREEWPESGRSHSALNREVMGRRKDGGEVPVEIGINPIRTSDGLRMIASIADISERKRAEAQRELLVAELNHRVKNTLAVVQGLAHQTFRRGEPALRRAFEGRLMALAAAHDLLTRSNWENASLSEVVAGTLRLAAGSEDRLIARGPRVYLNPRGALAVGLALHELFTNALKYGALSNDTGRVTLDWKTAADGRTLELQWIETGGPPVAAPAQRGFGSLLLEQTLAHDLDAEVAIDYAENGLICIMKVPLGGAGGQIWLG